MNWQGRDSTTATLLHGYTLVLRRQRRPSQSGSSCAGDDIADWHFALVRGPRTTFYCCADTALQLDR